MISVGIVEDHEEYRQSLVFLISSFPGYRVEWSFSNAEDALENTIPCDVMLLDINLPNISGTEAIPLFRIRFPEQKIIILTIQEDDESILQAIRNGADGYLLKKTNPQHILDAIRHVHEGGAALTPLIAKQVLAFFKPAKPVVDAANRLTQRESEILDLIVHGLSTASIANKLFISQQTVRNHVKKIYEKLQVHSKAQAVAKAMKSKW